MSITNRNSIYDAVNSALNSTNSLVDGRDADSFYGFITDLSRLINFYDKSNKLNGNWEPFILKDPVFLQTDIIRFDSAQMSFLITQLTKTVDSYFTKGHLNLIGTPIAKLIDLTIQICLRFNEWSGLMISTVQDYELKTFLLNAIEVTVAPVFWALLQLNDYLVRNNTIKHLPIVREGDRVKFDSVLWSLNKEKQPFWEVFGEKSVAPFSDANFSYQKINWAAQIVFANLIEVQKIASHKQQDVLDKVSGYPDTLLLRAMVKLLKHSQKEMNGLTAKHLDFYYKQVLHQKKRLGSPDKAFVSLKLTKLTETFTIDDTMLFSAGVDKNKNPITFKPKISTVINPAKIDKAFALSVLKHNAFSRLNLIEVDSAGKVVKNEDGIVQSWPTFGNTSYSADNLQKLGIAFSSPLLLLSSGTREIVLHFIFQDDVSQNFLNKGSYFLSTEKEWLSVSAVFNQVDTGSQKGWMTTITVDADAPAITNFKVNPDGYSSDWPLLKCLFSDFEGVNSPPVVASLQINTNVIGLTSYTFSNDNGALNPSKPFQLFGPVSKEGSSFFMGSNELLSKPLSELNIALDWKGLPSDFESYYSVYTDYLIWSILNGSVIGPSTSGNEKKSSFIGTIADYFNKNKASKESISSKIKAYRKIHPDIDSFFFPSLGFRVNFQILSNGEWKNIDLTRKTDCNMLLSDSNCQAPTVSLSDKPYQSLFSVKDENSSSSNQEVLETNSFFEYSGDPITFHYDVGLQNLVNTKINQSSQSGFIRMTLEDPDYAFGGDLFPKVVSFVALANAETLIIASKKPKKAGGIIPAPNEPFVPTVSGVKLNYKAEKIYDLNYGEDYPIQCFQYGLFQNYLIYDSTKNVDVYANQIGKGVCDNDSSILGVSLFPKIENDAILFLELKDVISPTELSVYFELKQTALKKEQIVNSYKYYCLVKDEWKEVKTVNDGTNGFRCSGIIKFDLEFEMETDHTIMPSKSYWIAAVLNGDNGNLCNALFFDSNCVEVQRSSIDYLNSLSKPFLNEGTITKMVKSTSEIASIVQPFKSFGGKAADTTKLFNKAVSSRIKTKNRATTSRDIAEIVYAKFDEIFYTKVRFNKSTKVLGLYLVQKVQKMDDSNATEPFASSCLCKEVSDSVSKVSAYPNIEVDSFDFSYFTVSADVYIDDAFNAEIVGTKITQALKVFLSPWVESDNYQIPIDQGISEVQIADFVNGFNEVDKIENITLLVKTKKNDVKLNASTNMLVPKEDSILMVPSSKQCLTYMSA